MLFGLKLKSTNLRRLYISSIPWSIVIAVLFCSGDSGRPERKKKGNLCSEGIGFSCFSLCSFAVHVHWTFTVCSCSCYCNFGVVVSWKEEPADSFYQCMLKMHLCCLAFCFCFAFVFFFCLFGAIKLPVSVPWQPST